MQDFTQHVSTRVTPQSKPIPGKAQVKNSAGGYVYAVDDFTRLHRFLVLGTEGGTYYATERELTQENAKCAVDCIRSNGTRVVELVREISTSGRAPKNDAALFILAMASALGDQATRQAAYRALPEVARIGTHLFQFLTYRQAFGGWGRGLRRAVQQWYAGKDADRLAYQVLKYRQRDGWTHRDVLRKAHPQPDETGILNWVAHPERYGEDGRFTAPHPQIAAFLSLQREGLPAGEVAARVREHRLTREMIPTEYLNDPVVANALLYDMPMTAMVRNLGNLTRLGVVDFGSEATKFVVEKLADQEQITRSRIHPIALLNAMKVYESGRGFRGSHTWHPVPSVVDALDEAFYLAFGNVRKSGKRILIGLDVSGSMSQGSIAGSLLTPREAASAMALITVRAETDVEVIAFSSGTGAMSHGRSGVVPFPISDRQRLTDVVRHTERMPFAGTDCALPMLYAEAQNRKVDGFLVLTDNETWKGTMHPSQALVRYRQKSGIDARCVVVAMTSTNFSIADPDDPGMLDVVGFDTVAPSLISDFIAEGIG